MRVKKFKDYLSESSPRDVERSMRSDIYDLAKVKEGKKYADDKAASSDLSKVKKAFDKYMKSNNITKSSNGRYMFAGNTSWFTSPAFLSNKISF